MRVKSLVLGSRREFKVSDFGLWGLGYSIVLCEVGFGIRCCGWGVRVYGLRRMQSDLGWRWLVRSIKL